MTDRRWPSDDRAPLDAHWLCAAHHDSPNGSCEVCDRLAFAIAQAAQCSETTAGKPAEAAAMTMGRAGQNSTQLPSHDPKVENHSPEASSRSRDKSGSTWSP